MASDDFTGTNGDAVTGRTGWTDLGFSGSSDIFEIQSNQCGVFSTPFSNVGIYYAGSGEPNCQVVVVGDALVDDVRREVCVFCDPARGTDADKKGYNARLSSISTGNYTQIYLYRGDTYMTNVGGTWSTSTDHTVRIFADVTGADTLLSVWVDGVLKIDAYDDTLDTYSSGDPGIVSREQSNTPENSVFDDWTDLAAAGGGPWTIPVDPGGTPY
jgi:hypothetical protein